MEFSTLLRDQVLSAFYRFPNVSITVCLRMSKKITNMSKVDVTDVRKCVSNLVYEGLLRETTRANRLPPIYCVTENGVRLCTEKLSFSNDECYNDKPLKSYEQKTLQEALQREIKFANDQELVFQFIQQCYDTHHIQPSTLMIQDCLRKSTNENNLVYTQAVLAQLNVNGEVECTCKQMLWGLKRRKEETTM